MQRGCASFLCYRWATAAAISRRNVSIPMTKIRPASQPALPVFRSLHWLRTTARETLPTDGSSLLQFVALLPSHWRALPWLDLFALFVLGLVTLISIWRVAFGLLGPLPPRKLHVSGEDYLMLAAGAAAWIYGLFLPASLGWGRFAVIVNLLLQSLFLMFVVSGIAALMLLLPGTGGNAQDLLEKFRKHRNAPMVGAKRRKF
jgi:hypothetical protein